MRVGNTPMIKISDKLYAKLESVNPLSFIDLRIQKYDKLGVYEDFK